MIFAVRRDSTCGFAENTLQFLPGVTDELSNTFNFLNNQGVENDEKMSQIVFSFFELGWSPDIATGLHPKC